MVAQEMRQDGFWQFWQCWDFGIGKPYLGPQSIRIMAFMAIIVGFGLLFYILWGFR